MLFKSVRFIFVYDVTMARKYVKKDKAYWGNKSKTKIVAKKSNVIFKDKGKTATVKIVSEKNKPFYHRKSV